MMYAGSAHRPRILAAGVGPVPPESPGRLFAPGLRIWGIARELARAGHPVRLALVHFFGQALDELRVHDLAPASPGSDSESYEPDFPPARVVALGEGGLAKALGDEAREFGARAAAGCTDLINRELAAIPDAPPLWMDYFGDPMAERQMLARLFESDESLADQWATLVPALRRADRVSGCSRWQAGALLGELAAVGRLNRRTADIPLAGVIPPWIEPIPPSPEPGPFLRGPVAPPDAFIVIQTGGFNTWLDVETLFESLELAMAANPRIHFACTGGAIPGHNERSFGAFQKLVAASPRRDRFHFLGWLELGRVPRVIAESDIGLNVDRPGPEGWLGTRNRIMDWLLGGLAVVSTLGCELAEELVDPGWIAGVPQGNPKALADAILEMAGNPVPWKMKAAEAARHLRDRHSPGRCLAPLLEWAKAPERAPDLAAWAKGESEPAALWTAAEGATRLAAEMESWRLRALRAESRIAEWEGSGVVRAALRLRRFLRGGK